MCWYKLCGLIDYITTIVEAAEAGIPISAYRTFYGRIRAFRHVRLGALLSTDACGMVE